MGDVAISFDAPDLDLSGSEETPDLGVGEGTETPDTGVEGEHGEPAEPEPGKPFLAVENGKLSEAAKRHLEKLKLENPPLAKAVQRALFAEDRLRKELPGGFKEVTALREKIEQLGGDEGIQSLHAELEGWKDFDAKYTAGDPKVLEFLTETPEAQAAFLKIAPAVFGKFQEANPEGYGAYISQVFVADMRDNEIPMTVQLLGSLLGRATLTEPDKAEATKLYAALTGYINRIGEFAKKPVSVPAATKPAGADPRAAELDTREQALRRQEWSGETNRQHSRIFSDAWKRLGINVPKDKVDVVRDIYGIELAKRLEAKKDFTPNMGRYFSAKQKDGFLRLHESTFKEAVPLALRVALARAGINAKKAPPAAAVPGAQPARAAAPAPGFIPVAQKPSMTEVNNNLTTPAMWQSGEAILKSGKKVTWS